MDNEALLTLIFGIVASLAAMASLAIATIQILKPRRPLLDPEAGYLLCRLPV
jgi:hypothetical protein